MDKTLVTAQGKSKAEFFMHIRESGQQRLKEF